MVDIEQISWEWALHLAKNKNDISQLAAMLREEIGTKPLPLEVLNYLADFLEGKESIPKRRGVKSGLKGKAASVIRFEYRLLANKDFFEMARKAGLPYTNKTQVIGYLADRFNTRPATIRDVVAKRKTFAEK